jgi:hypothetical protein
VSVVLERKIALRGNDLFYEGVATSTRFSFPPEPHFRHRGFGVIQQADDTKPHVFAIWGLIAKRSSGSRKVVKWLVLPEIAFASC